MTLPLGIPIQSVQVDSANIPTEDLQKQRGDLHLSLFVQSRAQMSTLSQCLPWPPSLAGLWSRSGKLATERRSLSEEAGVAVNHLRVAGVTVELWDH